MLNKCKYNKKRPRRLPRSSFLFGAKEASFSQIYLQSLYHLNLFVSIKRPLMVNVTGNSRRRSIKSCVDCSHCGSERASASSYTLYCALVIVLPCHTSGVSGPIKFPDLMAWVLAHRKNFLSRFPFSCGFLTKLKSVICALRSLPPLRSGYGRSAHKILCVITP